MKAFARERRAIAAAVFAFFAVAYGGLAFLAPGEVTNMMLAMTGVYGVAFFALSAGYFWARWFALGVALFGSLQGVMSVVQLGAETILLVFLGAHVVAAGSLWGRGISALFDGQKEWRQRYSMDDTAVARLGQAITRAGMSLPMVLLYAFAPRTGSLVFVAATLAVVGVWQLVRARTAGLLALGGAGVASALSLPTSGAELQYLLIGAGATALLFWAVAPFVRQLVRALRSPEAA